MIDITREFKEVLRFAPFTMQDVKQSDGEMFNFPIFPNGETVQVYANKVKQFQLGNWKGYAWNIEDHWGFAELAFDTHIDGYVYVKHEVLDRLEKLLK